MTVAIIIGALVLSIMLLGLNGNVARLANALEAQNEHYGINKKRSLVEIVNESMKETGDAS